MFSKLHFLVFKIVAEKSFTTYLWSEVDHNIVNVCKCQICILRFLVSIVFNHEIYQIWKLYTVMPLLTSWVNQKLSLWTYRTEILCKTSLSDLFFAKDGVPEIFFKASRHIKKEVLNAHGGRRVRKNTVKEKIPSWTKKEEEG